MALGEGAIPWHASPPPLPRSASHAPPPPPPRGTHLTPPPSPLPKGCHARVPLRGWGLRRRKTVLQLRPRHPQNRRKQAPDLRRAPAAGRSPANRRRLSVNRHRSTASRPRRPFGTEGGRLPLPQEQLRLPPSHSIQVDHPLPLFLYPPLPRSNKQFGPKSIQSKRECSVDRGGGGAGTCFNFHSGRGGPLPSPPPCSSKSLGGGGGGLAPVLEPLDVVY